MKKRITDIVTIILGALIFALDVNLFVIPNDFGEGELPGSPSFYTTYSNGLLVLLTSYLILYYWWSATNSWISRQLYIQLSLSYSILSSCILQRAGASHPMI